MSAVSPREEFSEQEVTYISEVEGRVIIIERVPARVSLSTGERLYSPETVERIQAIIWGQAPPARTVSAPVYEFSDISAS
jgi:HTH-type transcriptional regulator / antitoxin MqsA